MTQRGSPISADGRRGLTLLPGSARTPAPPLPARSDGTSRHSALARSTLEVRAALEEAAAAAAVAATRARAVAAMLDSALLTLEAETGAAATWPIRLHSDPGLSPREREVLALVAEGYSNKAIADALYLSPNTIKTHVASLLSKLDVATRAQLAAVAIRRGLARPGAAPPVLAAAP